MGDVVSLPCINGKRYIRIYPATKARDEGRATTRENGLEVRVGDRRRPEKVSVVTNPSKRDILPMNLGDDRRMGKKS